MKYKSYPETFWKQLNETLAELKKNKTQLVALFDADGTLWDTDLGENLFNFTIDNRLVSLPENPWSHYLELKKNDPGTGYVWLAQIYKGIPLDQVRKWADEAFASIKPFPIFEEQQKLIGILKQNDVTIKVITASITWAVQPGARALGLSDNDVLGVETNIENGNITEKQNGVITYRAGKVAAYKQKQSIIPFFAAGNSEGDIDLLESASHIRLAVSAANREDRLYRTEFKLQELAKERNWIYHRFI